MNLTPTFSTFCGAVILGGGFRMGWGLVEVVFQLLAKAVS